MNKILLNNGEEYEVLLAGESSGVLWLAINHMSFKEAYTTFSDPDNTCRIIAREKDEYSGFIDLIHISIDQTGAANIALRKPQ